MLEAISVECWSLQKEQSKCVQQIALLTPQHRLQIKCGLVGRLRRLACGVQEKGRPVCESEQKRVFAQCKQNKKELQEKECLKQFRSSVGACEKKLAISLTSPRLQKKVGSCYQTAVNNHWKCRQNDEEEEEEEIPSVHSESDDDLDYVQALEIDLGI